MKLGYTANLISVGSTSFSVDYYDGSDLVSTNDSAARNIKQEQGSDGARETDVADSDDPL